MKKRTVAFVMALALSLSVFYIAYAEEEEIKDGIYTYTVLKGEAVVTAVEDVEGKVEVPERIGGYTVVEIGTGAFGGNTKTTEVVFPDTVKKIGSMCFGYCENLKKVHLPSKLEMLDDKTFFRCSTLIGVTIPDGAWRIGKQAFLQCENLSSVGIPNSVTTIEDNAFEGVDNLTIHCNLDYEKCPAYLWADARDIPCEELITVYVNDKKIEFDQLPVTEKKKFRTLVPLRSVLEEMGAVIEWHDDMGPSGEYASIDIGNDRILLKPGEDFMRVNGETWPVSCPSTEYNGRILLPIRDVVQVAGGKVSWNEDTKEIKITYNK